MRLIDIINGPWAITPEMLNEIRSIYAKHMRGEKIDKAVLEQLAAANGAKKQAAAQGLEIVNGTAIIPIEGVIAKKMNIFMALCGGASTQLVERDIRQALADDTVSQIMLYVDSPGGTVDGTFELSNFIYANRGKKPIIAFSDGSMYSAAYAIGSAADAAYISSMAAGVGSIGVVVGHEDVSKMEEKMGIKTTEIYAGKYKRIASSYQPLSQDGRDAIQSEVDYLYSVFVDTVARNRGVTSEQVLADMSTDVKSAFMGQQAVDAGLVDGVATMEEIINKNIPQRRAGVVMQAVVPAALKSAEAGSAEATKEETMDLKDLKEKHADLYTAVFEEGKKTGLEEGAAAGSTAQLERIKSVKAVAMPGHEALIESLMFDGKTSGPEAAMAVVSAENKKRAGRLADFKADGASVLVPVSDGTAADLAAAQKPAEDKSLPVEERAKESWDASADLRTEFSGSFEGYLAYYKAMDAGSVRIIGAKK